jgi:hypothetical protein
MRWVPTVYLRRRQQEISLRCEVSAQSAQPPVHTASLNTEQTPDSDDNRPWKYTKYRTGKVSSLLQPADKRASDELQTCFRPLETLPRMGEW